MASVAGVRWSFSSGTERRRLASLLQRQVASSSELMTSAGRALRELLDDGEDFLLHVPACAALERGWLRVRGISAALCGP